MKILLKKMNFLPIIYMYIMFNYITGLICYRGERRMGDCRLYKCQCGYEKMIMLGAGRGAQNLKIISMTVPEKVFEEFSREHLVGKVSEYGMVNSVISCTECGELNTVTEFSYTLEDKEIVYVSPCPGCGEICPPLKDPENIPCPRCGAEMKYSPVGSWD